MGEQSEKIKKNICMGLLAHVDAGKTTLSEALLYLSGKIRKLGRVDHKDAYLDTSPLERERGITIFSKQAVLDFPKYKTYHSGYAWACGFFCRDGTYLAGSGLCSAFD